jgi:hypothetical protein
MHAPTGWPASATTWPFTLPLVLATVLCVACSVGPDRRASETARDNSDLPGQPVGSSPPTSVAGETPITLTIADTVVTAHLADNVTARALAAQLPLTLTFRDFNRVEKIATLPGPLSTDGVPAGAAPGIGDIRLRSWSA